MTNKGNPDGARDAWLSRRREMERRRLRGRPDGTTVKGRRRRLRRGLVPALFAAAGVALHVAGLFARGVANAKDIRLTTLELTFDNLPPAFDGFTIIQFTDVHVDALPQAAATAAALAAPVDGDLGILTGDYVDDVTAPLATVEGALRALVDAGRGPDGCVAILGNHDRGSLAAAFEGFGARVLVNESLTLERQGQTLTLTGTDDVHYFYTPAADAALRESRGDFKVALVHSAEIADVAAAAGFDLYLCGHTHGGQVCLPGGRPVLTNLSRFRRYARGLWRHGAMVGYTSTGVGVSGLPVRFNCRGEVAVLVLRRTEAAD